MFCVSDWYIVSPSSWVVDGRTVLLLLKLFSNNLTYVSLHAACHHKLRLHSSLPSSTNLEQLAAGRGQSCRHELLVFSFPLSKLRQELNNYSASTSVTKTIVPRTPRDFICLITYRICAETGFFAVRPGKLYLIQLLCSIVVSFACSLRHNFVL